MAAEQKQNTRAVETLTFQLIVLMNLITKPFNHTHGADHDVSLSEWRCIMWLAAAPGSSGQETANGIGMDRMNVSRSLRSLEKKGFSWRREDSSDRKKWRWRLTDDGWEIYDGIIPHALARDAEFTKHLSSQDREIVAGFLTNAIRHLREPDQEGGT